MAQLVLFLGILAAHPVFAQNFFTGPERFDAYYDMVCGPAEKLPDSAEIHQARANFQSFLRDPASKRLPDIENPMRGSAAFDLFVLCQSVLSFQERLISSPCVDDKGQAIDPEPALSYCGEQRSQPQL